MKKITSLVFLLLFAIPLLGQGSGYLVIYKPGKKKRYEYHVGDMIAIQPKQEFPVQRGAIYAVSDSAVYFSKDDSLLFSEFEAVIIKEKVKPLNERMWLNNFIATTGSIAIWQIAWLVNQGKLSPDVKSAPYIIGTATILPVIINQACRIFVRGSRRIGPGEWQVGTVIMPSNQ